jgi:Transposase DDE domain group 1
VADGVCQVNLVRWRAPRAVHDPVKVIADLAAALTLGGDCLADIALLREQPQLAGPVASDPVVSRLVAALAGDLPRSLKAIRGGRAAAGSGPGPWLAGWGQSTS